MESSVDNFKLYFDISETETPDYEQMCPLNVDYDQGETLDTFYTLCSKFANNVKTALDPTWSTSFKFDKADPVAQFIIAKEYAVGSAATADVKIVNKLKGTTGKQLVFTATLSGISYSAVTEEVLQIDFDLKVYKNTTFTETDYSA
jgi:hypothetical protein